jgi:hypothetical protein
VLDTNEGGPSAPMKFFGIPSNQFLYTGCLKIHDAVPGARFRIDSSKRVCQCGEPSHALMSANFCSIQSAISENILCCLKSLKHPKTYLLRSLHCSRSALIDLRCISLTLKALFQCAHSFAQFCRSSARAGHTSLRLVEAVAAFCVL